jgi:hypothetical protein
MLQSASSQLTPEQEQAIGAAGAAVGGVIAIIYLAVIVISVISLWKIFTKAGEPGWAAIVPIYNLIVLIKIVGKPLWWIVLLIIPCVNFIILILLSLELAKAFGKSGGFGVGLALLSPIFLPILAFGDARYVGTKTA